MRICFYNMNHIGDIYFMSLFLNIICKQNENINFMYYTINGDIFFDNIPNLSRITPIDDNYSSKLVNGDPPENLLDNSVLTFLINNRMQSVDMRVFNFRYTETLFINTWCIPLNHGEFDIISAIKGYSDIISNVNKNYGFSLNFIINNHIELLSKNVSLNNNYSLVNNLEKFDNLEETIFIFNFSPRSLQYNMLYLNNYIEFLSKDSKIILSTYDILFENNKNIKFIDKDYSINPIPSCKNLLHIWEIAIKCKKIFILPTGGSWTFLHKLKQIKPEQIYMFNHVGYTIVLNNFINTLTGEEKNLINSFEF